MNENSGAPDPEQGLYRKYDVTRLNDPTGKHKDCTYYILDLDHDPHSVAALLAYAKSCEAQYPTLAFDLRHTAAATARKLNVPCVQTEVAYTRNEELATALERASMDASGPTDYTMRVDKLVPLVADALRALPPTDERVIACLRACDGLATVDLAGNKRGWLAELCGDAVKLDEPYRAGAQKCLAIVKEMRASLVHTDGADYGILSRLEYRLQKVVDMPVAPSPTIVSPHATYAAPQASPSVAPAVHVGPAVAAPDPFNCPSCGAHDFGLNRPRCPHCFYVVPL